MTVCGSGSELGSDLSPSTDLLCNQGGQFPPLGLSFLIGEHSDRQGCPGSEGGGGSGTQRGLGIGCFPLVCEQVVHPVPGLASCG